MFFSFVLSLYTSYITCDKLLSLTPVENAYYISPSIYASKYSIMMADSIYLHLTLLLTQEACWASLSEDLYVATQLSVDIPSYFTKYYINHLST